MKTNLDSLYKTDTDCETTGIWLMINEEVGFRVKRFGGKNKLKIAEKLAKLQKPYSRQIELGTMDQKILDQIHVKVFVEECIVDWKGIEIDGQPVEYSNEQCIEMLRELPDLTDSLVQYASDIGNYREQVGN
jgi:hypothetical protein